MTACIAWLTHDGSHRERFIFAAYFVIASQSIVKLNLAPALPNMVLNCSEVQIHINQLQNNRGRVTYMWLSVVITVTVNCHYTMNVICDTHGYCQFPSPNCTLQPLTWLQPWNGGASHVIWWVFGVWDTAVLIVLVVWVIPVCNEQMELGIVKQLYLIT